MIPILNKIRKGDPNNATRWSSVVESTDAEIPAVQFMIDLCLRRRGWIPVFLECLAGTPNLFQIASTADALDAPVVHCVLRQCLETNVQPNADETATSFTELTEQQRLERYAKEICLLDLVERLLIGLSSTNGMHVMDPLSFVLYVLLPCLRVDHPNLHTVLLLVKLVLKYWDENDEKSVVGEMLRCSLAEVQEGSIKIFEIK
jgi:hypothetical protein